MPCGRKAANSQKGGGFGKALGAHSNKYGKRLDYRTPDASKLHGVNEELNASTQKNDQSVIEPTNLEDFIQHKLNAQTNLVDYNRQSKKSNSIQIINHSKPLTRRDLPDESAYTHHSIPLPPIAFRDRTTRVLDFAITLGYFLSENPDVSLDDVSSCSSNASHHDEDPTSANSESGSESDECGDSDTDEECNSEDEDSEGSDKPAYQAPSVDNDHSAQEAKKSVPILKTRAGSRLDDAAALRQSTKLSSGRDLLNALVVHFSNVDSCAPFADKNSIAQVEEKSFTDWRSHLEEERDRSQSISPFEKNLNFWKELWHTIERSDLVLEITDARNPLLFHSPRLSEFVEKCRKQYVLVLNKADYLTKTQRDHWKAYFKDQGINVLMYSALKEIQVNQKNDAIRDMANSDETNKTEPHIGLDQFGDDALDLREKLDPSVCVQSVCDWEGVSNREELLTWLNDTAAEQSEKLTKRIEMVRLFLQAWKQLMRDVDVKTIRKAYRSIVRSLRTKIEAPIPDRSKEFEKDVIGFLFGNPLLISSTKQGAPEFTAGTIGFPNVGKSSVINSLLGPLKRVGVSGTPGKTKHIQTLHIPESSVQLCDCPGLVMPISNRAKEDLVINGITSVDTFRGDLTLAISHILKRIPHKLQVTFSIPDEKMKKVWDLMEIDLHQAGLILVDLVAGQRNYFAAGRGGQKDLIRSCRLIIKSYIRGGALGYCEKCPTATDSLWKQENDIMWRSQSKFILSKLR